MDSVIFYSFYTPTPSPHPPHISDKRIDNFSISYVISVKTSKWLTTDDSIFLNLNKLFLIYKMDNYI